MKAAALERAPADRRESRRALLTLRLVVGITVVSSIFHYADNFVRYDQYPQSEQSARIITKPVVAIAWVAFTLFAVAGYLLYRRAKWRPAAAALAVYSFSGLISPLHYTSASPSDLDVAQNLFIVTDAIAGAAVFGFAIWILLQDRPAHST